MLNIELFLEIHSIVMKFNPSLRTWGMSGNKLGVYCDYEMKQPLVNPYTIQTIELKRGHSILEGNNGLAIVYDSSVSNSLIYSLIDKDNNIAAGTNNKFILRQYLIKIYEHVKY